MRESVMSTAEFKSMLTLAHDALRLEIEFAGTTGLRSREQFVLTWKEVDPSKRKLYVSQQDKWKPLRIVPLSSAMSEKLRLKRAASNASDEELVFPQRLRRVQKTKFAPGDFREVSKRVAALEPEWKGAAHRTWYDLRYFAINSWQKAELPDWRDFAGLSDPFHAKTWARDLVQPMNADFQIMDDIAASGVLTGTPT